MEVVVSLLDLVHAALQVSVELHPLRLQTNQHLVRPTLTCQDDCFLSDKRKKNTMKNGEIINRLIYNEKNCWLGNYDIQIQHLHTSEVQNNTTTTQIM